ncbi:MAG: beta-galactosidase trimerization domain-containing protein [Pirellulaceae bacterium]|nr:beta-galactosidase trimerization domain-containing protein [Pirellulaceae bacterium]
MLLAGRVLSAEEADLPPRTVPQRLPCRPIPPWLETHQRIGHLPGSLAMAEQFLKAGYNVVTLNVLGQWEVVGPSAALYPPERVQQAEQYMRTHVERCHAAGAKAIFYLGPVQVPSGNKIFVQAHPDWLRIRPNGQPDPTPNFANIRSGYADWLLNQLAYVTRAFQVDGFWFDGYAPVHLHTYDDATRQAFRDYAGGQELPLPLNDVPDSPMYFDPTRDPVTRLYLRWHEEHFVEFADRMRQTIRRENPEAIIYVNHSANRTWYFPSMYMGEYPLNYSSAVDVSSVELYWDVPGDPLYQQFVYAFLQGVTQERGAAVWIQPSAHGISGISSPIEIQLRGLEGLPWGVHPEFVESTGREEYYRLHVANIQAREEWLAQSRTLSYVGVVASEQTRTLYGQASLPLYFSHTLGAFRAYFEKHVPVRVLTECDLEDAELLGVRVLVMPNVACLSDRAAEVVRRFVHAGGGLIATFETSLYDENFRKRADFALADLFQARYVGTHTVTQRVENLSLTLDQAHSIVADPLIQTKRNNAWLQPGNPPDQGSLALVASAAEVTALDGGQIIATYNVNLPAEKAGARHPAIIVSEHGRGRVVFFPAAVDKGMFFYPDTYMRQMLANAARWAAHDELPPVEVEGPLILTTTFRTQPPRRRTVVHLLNQASSWGMHSIYQKLAPLPEELSRQWGFPNQSELRGTWPVREEIIPLHDIKVICRMPHVRRATQQPEGIVLPLVPRPDGVEVTVPVVGMHTLVVFEE